MDIPVNIQNRGVSIITFPFVSSAVVKTRMVALLFTVLRECLKS